MKTYPTPETDSVYLRVNDDRANFENMKSSSKRIERRLAECREALQYELTHLKCEYIGKCNSSKCRFHIIQEALTNTSFT